MTASPKRGEFHHSPLSVLDLGLDRIDRIGRLDLERDCLVSESLDEDLHVVGLVDARMS